MAITFILNDEAVNDQTTGLQINDSADGFTDTDVAGRVPDLPRDDAVATQHISDRRWRRDQNEFGDRQRLGG